MLYNVAEYGADPACASQARLSRVIVLIGLSSLLNAASLREWPIQAARGRTLAAPPAGAGAERDQPIDPERAEPKGGGNEAGRAGY